MTTHHFACEQAQSTIIMITPLFLMNEQVRTVLQCGHHSSRGRAGEVRKRKQCSLEELEQYHDIFTIFLPAGRQGHTYTKGFSGRY